MNFEDNIKGQHINSKSQTAINCMEITDNTINDKTRNDSAMYGHQVTLEEVLYSREVRSRKQAQLISSYMKGKSDVCLVCFTLNVAGNIKRSFLIDIAFQEGIGIIRKELGNPYYAEICTLKTGNEAYFVYPKTAGEIKNRCVKIEESFAVGRIFDIDVIDCNGSKVSRSAVRKCLICNRAGHECSRNQTHDYETVVADTNKILFEFVSDSLASKAVSALKKEVELTPKPGLVDSNNSGSHSDMDLSLMMRSAISLQQFFRRFIEIGINCGRQTEICAEEIKRAGIEAEQKMFEHTGGVNTHKGAIYIMGLLLVALGVLLSASHCEDDIFTLASKIAKEIKKINVKDEQTSMKRKKTHGESVKARFNIGGVSEEACSGFPTLKDILRFMQRTKNLHLALIYSISICDDTNVAYRGGIEGLRFTKLEAEKIIRWYEEGNVEQDELEAEILCFDENLINRSLSPGGSADLIAAAMFLDEISIRD